ncbi:hypothetical protein ERJ75_000213100 [Trypanosoma vivax]|uniref:Uncharacterized protein n=1 Tax=Trypanosoma vivax (strain Y486) TaxID=1055687 RepID=G0U9W1_TRYVY|nr:hypothetical protein TRVL_02111 [Trypanosoma vivax]KAH8618981.1 hypothetical protein ERJ75_000213100 [Trypanosoma vivax]CCC52592.1 conserved hypothetical protein [Trypanosoma vivax Y486]
MRRGFLLRCLPKEFNLTVSHGPGFLDKVLSSVIQPSKLASYADEMTLIVPQLSAQHTVSVLELFSRHGVRHEGVMLSCLWRVFKFDWSTSGGASDTEVKYGIACCTSVAFRTMCQQGFIHDAQLLAIAIGRCIECAPFMSLGGVSAVYSALKVLDRKFFSLSEVALHSGGLLADVVPESNADSSTVFSSQPNLLDVLCGELECRLRGIAAYGTSDYSATEVKELMESISVVGVTDATVLSTLQRLLGPMTFPTADVLDMLIGIHGIHARVIDVLNHDGDCDTLFQLERSALVKVLTDKVLSAGVFTRFRRHSPELVLQFRRLFERYPTLAADSPELWDAVRVIRVAHKHAVGKPDDGRRLGGKLFTSEFTVKMKRVTSTSEEAEKFIPSQFKSWRGPAVCNGRHKPTKNRQKVGFGTRRISKDYIKLKRRKFAPAVW